MSAAGPSPARRLARGFLAVVPAPEVLDALGARLDHVRTRVGDGLAVRWAPREQWHVTVQFLGRVDDVDAVVGAVRAALHAAPMLEPLRIAGAGGFPSDRRATVLWADVQEGSDALAALAARVEASTTPLGFRPDGRPYRPHLTLARAPRSVDGRAFVEAFGRTAIGPAWIPSSVDLLSSDTRPDGARHHEVVRIAFPDGATPKSVGDA